MAPGFADDGDRQKFTNAYSQYRYDNTNGGVTYDSYLDWARSKPEGGAALCPSGSWIAQGTDGVTNYQVAGNPDDLAWARPHPSD